MCWSSSSAENFPNHNRRVVSIVFQNQAVEVVLYGETNELHPLAAFGGAKQKGLSHLGFGRFEKKPNSPLEVDPEHTLFMKDILSYLYGTWGLFQVSLCIFLGRFFRRWRIPRDGEKWNWGTVVINFRGDFWWKMGDGGRVVAKNHGWIWVEKKWWFFPWPAFLLAEMDGVVWFFQSIIWEGRWCWQQGEKLEYGMLDAIACKCQKGRGVFQYFNNGIPHFFSVLCRVFRENTQTFAVLYSVFPVNFAPPDLFAFTGTAHEGRMSKRTNIQSTYAPTAGIPRSSDLGRGVFGWRMGGFGGRQYTKKDTFISIFFMFEKGEVHTFLRCKATKNHRWEKKRHWLYDIRSRILCFSYTLAFFKCGEISGFQVLQSTKASCLIGWFPGHLCGTIPDIFVHWYVIPSLSFSTDHFNWYYPP